MSVRDGVPLAADTADVWLGKAVVHLAAACGVPGAALDDLTRPGLGATRLAPGARAFLVRLDESRLCVLCAALAAEATVNDYIHSHRPSYRGMLDKLSPAEKFSLAPRLLSGVDPFPPGSRVYEHLVRLFALQRELVQAWPHPTAPGDPADGGMSERFNPRIAHELLESVARGAKALGDLHDHPYRPTVGLALKVVDALGKRAEAAAAVPAPTVAELEDEEESLTAAAFAEEMIGA